MGYRKRGHGNICFHKHHVHPYIFHINMFQMKVLLQWLFQRNESGIQMQPTFIQTNIIKVNPGKTDKCRHGQGRQTKLTSAHITFIEGQHQTKNIRNTWVYISTQGEIGKQDTWEQSWTNQQQKQRTTKHGKEQEVTSKF